MCNRYTASSPLRISDRFRATSPVAPYVASVAPLRQGPYIKANGTTEVGQWGMIPPDSATAIPKTKDGKRLSTNNARIERVASAWTYRGPWAKGQRCLIAAEDYDEPYWGTLTNIWWRFRRADGDPWALAGLWSEWTDPATGEWVPSYTMLTQNCDAHPLLKLMHRPEVDRKTGIVLPPEKQDKRAVVPIERGDWDAWLHGTVEQARALIRLPALEVIAHGAADPAQQVELELDYG